MKKILIPILTCFFFFSISSCKKCQTCSNSLGSAFDVEVCQDEFDSKEEYELWIETYEAAGGDCQ